jgi:hypothetical protein
MTDIVLVSSGELEIIEVAIQGPPGVDGDNHDLVTVADSTSVHWSINEQQVSASVNFGTIEGTVCQGNDSRLNRDETTKFMQALMFGAL